MFDDNERIVCTMLVLRRISLACRCCLQKNIFSNPHACKTVFVLMMIVRNKGIGYLTTTPSTGHPHWPGSITGLPHPSPLTCCWCAKSGSPLRLVTHLITGGLPDGPENRPYHLGPESLHCTHIVRFTYPARGIFIWIELADNSPEKEGASTLEARNLT